MVFFISCVNLLLSKHSVHTNILSLFFVLPHSLKWKSTGCSTMPFSSQQLEHSFPFLFVHWFSSFGLVQVVSFDVFVLCNIECLSVSWCSIPPVVEGRLQLCTFQLRNGLLQVLYRPIQKRAYFRFPGEVYTMVIVKEQGENNYRKRA